MLSNPGVLDEDRIPQRELVVHRRDDLDRLLDTLRPTGIGPTDLAYLLGPTGTGKTMLARLALDLLADDDRMPGHHSTYINCWSIHERAGILYQVANEHRPALPPQGTVPRGRSLEIIREADDPTIVVLDEADQLSGMDVLYDLHECPGVHVVLIANREIDLFADMEDRLRSRLSVGTRIECDRYATDELAEILAKRADHALRNVGRYDRQLLEYIAHHSEGDARVAIRTLRVAATRAAGTLSRADVDDALPEAREQLRQKSIERLNAHQQTVYDIIVEQEPIAPRDIRERYRDRVDEPRTERTVRNYLSKLTQYNLVARSGEGPDRSYRTVDDHKVAVETR